MTDAGRGAPEIAEFVAFLGKERNDSPHTVKAYARDVADFAAFCGRYYGGDWSWGGVDRLAVRGWLAALEERLRAEITQVRASAPAATPVAAGSDGRVLQQVRALIEESERRQQQELALRFTQFATDFDVQRQLDMRRVNQLLGQFDSTTGAELRRTRQDLNNLIRVSQQGR